MKFEALIHRVIAYNHLASNLYFISLKWVERRFGMVIYTPLRNTTNSSQPTVVKGSVLIGEDGHIALQVNQD